MAKYQHATKGTIISVPEETALSSEWQPYPGGQEPKASSRGRGKNTKAAKPEPGAQEETTKE